MRRPPLVPARQSRTCSACSASRRRSPSRGWTRSSPGRTATQPRRTRVRDCEHRADDRKRELRRRADDRVLDAARARGHLRAVARARQGARQREERGPGGGGDADARPTPRSPRWPSSSRRARVSSRRRSRHSAGEAARTRPRRPTAAVKSQSRLEHVYRAAMRTSSRSTISARSRRKRELYRRLLADERRPARRGRARLVLGAQAELSRSLASRQSDELVALVAAALGLLEHGADAADISLWSTTPGSSGVVSCDEKGVLRAGSSNRSEQGEHLEVILGVALVELLPAGLADARVGGHVDAGLAPSTPDIHVPSVLVTRPLPVELGRLLAEVPDVAARVLRVPVDRALARAGRGGRGDRRRRRTALRRSSSSGASRSPRRVTAARP